jgi:predicted RNA-binding protein with PUA-like domain
LKHWLLKSEPSVFGLEQLRAAPKKTTHWDGVRNYQARNLLRDEIQVGDEAFLYHSNCAEPGIVGILRVVRSGYPDHTAFDPGHDHHDPGSTPENPRWYMVDVQLVRALKRVITLEELRAHQEQKLRDFQLLRRGNRLSVMPVSDVHWRFILSRE